jgi:hypothetical protein
MPSFPALSSFSARLRLIGLKLEKGHIAYSSHGSCSITTDPSAFLIPTSIAAMIGRINLHLSGHDRRRKTASTRPAHQVDESPFPMPVTSDPMAAGRHGLEFHRRSSDPV